MKTKASVRQLIRISLLAVIAFCLISPTIGRAQSFATEFLVGASRVWLPIKIERTERAAQSIFLAQPSPLQNWGIVGQTAEASYNGFLRTIVLKPEVLETGLHGRLQIASMSTLLRDHGRAAVVKVSVIFHELAHAEWDRLVSKVENPFDIKLMNLANSKIRPWFQRHSKSLNPFWPSIAVSELFGYHHGDLVLFFADEIEAVLHANGVYNNPKQPCSARFKNGPSVFIDHESDGSTYRNNFKLKSIWVGGQDVDLHDDNDPFMDEWQMALWDHFNQFYAPPRSRTELVAWMNQNPYWLSRLRACR